ncbi:MULTISPECIES: flavin reductase family protein [Thermomonospora]|uniref:Flavin reductase (DIM6/NTAB) family NADH-FMN oxidoreductase RutF n=1 Tax=Thermomonospora cellulosilytica TaxID=1411118 RepID=A0A7W3N132_9ACTN|nr:MULTISPECIES: flavin reductase family protein [Thermomonospora]MBA9005605.1 flavin reductase (DIM6/NTAB) family NADH-FMN oxidoreductase RutF [Thermomonospora cellulosilytica]
MSSDPAPPPPEMTDPRRLRRVLGTFATGVTVVTTGGATPHGMTANSFTSVSLDPPLVLICVGRTAILHRRLAVGFFGVSVLASHQQAVARHFADFSRPMGAAQFDGIDCEPGRVTGIPLISGALAHFECELWKSYDGGDHTIFLGRLLSIDRPESGDAALLFYQGRFHQLQPGWSEVTA